MKCCTSLVECSLFIRRILYVVKVALLACLTASRVCTQDSAVDVHDNEDDTVKNNFVYVAACRFFGHASHCCSVRYANPGF